METLRNAAWLALRELRRTWLSYVVTGVLALSSGLFAVAAFGGLFSLEGAGTSGEAFERAFNSSFLDFWFLAVTPLLAGNFVSKEYMISWTDPFSKRLSFLRSLPIATRELVLSRLIGTVPTLLYTAPLFFLPPYLFSGGFGAQDWYPWFVAEWLGYALVMVGLYLYLELGTTGKTYNLVMIPLFLGIVLLVGLLNFGFGVGIVEGTIRLAQTSGPLAAVVSLVAGLAGLSLWARATVLRLRKRDLAA